MSQESEAAAGRSGAEYDAVQLCERPIMMQHQAVDKPCLDEDPPT